MWVHARRDVILLYLSYPYSKQTDRQTDRQTTSVCEQKLIHAALIGWYTCLLGTMSQFSSHCMMPGRRLSEISNMFDIQNCSGRRRKSVYRGYICSQSISHSASENVGDQSPIVHHVGSFLGESQKWSAIAKSGHISCCVYEPLQRLLSKSYKSHLPLNMSLWYSDSPWNITLGTKRWKALLKTINILWAGSVDSPLSGFWLKDAGRRPRREHRLLLCNLALQICVPTPRDKQRQRAKCNIHFHIL